MRQVYFTIQWWLGCLQRRSFDFLSDGEAPWRDLERRLWVRGVRRDGVSSKCGTAVLCVEWFGGVVRSVSLSKFCLEEGNGE